LQDRSEYFVSGVPRDEAKAALASTIARSHS
jgi:hypothetical protein